MSFALPPDAKLSSTAPEPAAAAADEPADCCEVCLVKGEGFALVPCGHASFCESGGNRLNRVATLDYCPVCRENTSMVLCIFMSVEH